MSRFPTRCCWVLAVLASCSASVAPGSDAGLPDGGVAASLDAGGRGVDAGALLDAGADDAGTIDAGEVDAGAPDAGDVTDAGVIDAGAPDAGARLDAGATDAGVDASVPDAGFGLFPIEGFGAATRGGWQPGHDVYLVTSLANDGPGTLREGLDTATGPRVIQFALDGTIALTASLLVPSNLSIDGRGRHITLTGKGLILVGSDDVILTHLSIVDVGPKSEDGLRIGDPTGGASERVVVDHVTFRATGAHGDSANVDEAVSVIFGSKDITLAWLRVENWEKFLLIGNGDAPQSVDQAITVSLHHSYTTGTGRRHPQARYGVTDIWNCFFDDWYMFDWFYLAPYRESFGVQAQDSARIRFEHSWVWRQTHAKDLLSQANDATRCETNGRVDTIDVQVAPNPLPTAPLQFGVGCTTPTGWLRPYVVSLEPADAALRTKLQAQAGNPP